MSLVNEYGKPIEFSVKPYPIVWVYSPNNQYDFRHSNLIYAPKFGFIELKEHLKYAYSNVKSFSSVYHWSEKETRNNEIAFNIINEQIALLEERIEKYNKIGALTKKKIDRLNKQYSEDLKIYEEFLKNKESDSNELDSDEDIFDLVFNPTKPKKKVRNTLTARIEAEKGLSNNLIIISGKAGSGKTFEMMLLIKKHYENNLNGYYLTFNKLLANDVKLIVDKYQPRRTTTVKTLHSFFWHLCGGGKTGGTKILTVMSSKRSNVLKKTQEIKYQKIKEYLSHLPSDIDLNKLHPHSSWDKSLREYFLLFIAFAKKRNNKRLDNEERMRRAVLENELKRFYERDLNAIEHMVKSNVFLSDYSEVLRNILLAINDPKALYKKLEIDKLSDEEWKILVNDKNNGRDEYGNKISYAKTENDFCKMINRSLGGTLSKGKILFIDEAQDCELEERDVLLSLWKDRNIVVCTGGAEQLIRRDEECNWKVNGATGKTLHNIISIEKRNKTYRMKPSLVKLCNFIAKEFEINLDLSAHNINIEDEGNVIIELYDPYYNNLPNQVKKFVENGKENQLTPYESILFMSTSAATSSDNDDSANMFNTVNKDNQVSIDSLDNFHYSEKKYKKSNLSKLCGLEDQDIFFYNQQGKNYSEDDDEEQEATSDTYRSLFYESCRGLEAWSAVCLDIDLFFQNIVNSK